MKVLIADSFEAEGVQRLAALGCTVTQDADLSGPALAESAKDTAADVLIVRSTKVDKPVLDVADHLKLVIRAGAGFDNIDFKHARTRGICVANCPGTNSVAVAELTFGLMLALDRRIVDNTVDLRRGVWNKKEYGKARGLKGRTLGIVGLGQIGAALARRAKAFEMDLLYFDVVAYPDLEKEVGIRRADLETIYRQADFITLHVPLIDATRHMIGEKQLAMMKPTTFIINCSRGGVVDQKALIAALEQNRIAGAGLDVYEIEPGATDTAFADAVIHHPRVYGTHHIGASTDQAQWAVAEEVVRIVESFQRTGQVLHCVNA